MKHYKRIWRINSSSEDETSQKKVSKKRKFIKRRSIQCPEKCGKSVVNLPRHLRLKHGYSDEHAKHVILHFGLRSTSTRIHPDNRKHKEYHKKKPNVL